MPPAKLIIVLIFANLFLLCQSLWSASQAGSNPELIEAAQGEGNVSYYTTMTLSQSKKVVDRFQQKYPFIKVELFRSGGDAILNRIENEARGGLYAWDVDIVTRRSSSAADECQTDNALPFP